ncbi:helix-turn-helix domain-containing protein [Streptomyces sp. CS7]|uniref:helix-turn-helix domain-containing protein n=1 Tax=Streptomyces sp. CS-7 TaxID=2906769 RepID=UPI0021B21F9C|nr:helix-turn-helix transcriptional regulator [Streptomyces sp. CS-7]MCT6780567.1 helix-turn-helix domain-containing protein [Streptomyces sp. CS-7]
MKLSVRRCTNCETSLNQYNSDSVCGPCSRMEAAPSVPDRAWRADEVQRALAAWDFGELLRLLRRRSGLSQMDVRALTGLTQSYISDLENGRKQLGGRDAIIDLLNGMGLPADLRPLLLAPFMEHARPPAANTLDPAMPWTRDRMVAELEVAVGGSMKRRSVLALGGAVMSQYILQSAIAPAEALAAEVQNGAPVTPKLLQSMQAITDEFRQLDASSGSGALADTAKRHLKVLVGWLRSGSYDEETGRRLAGVTADAAMQAGWYTFDSGKRDAALALFAGALRASHSSGDSRLRAGALSFLAIYNYSVGDPREAVTAARTGRQSISDQDAPALHAMLLTRAARGHARLREERHALAALNEAEELCARGIGEDDPHWLYWINRGEIFGQRGSCYLELGRPIEAAQAFDAARDVFSREEVRTRAQFLSRAATAQMRAGDADAGCAIGQEVLDLVEGIKSARLDENLRNMLTEAQQLNSARSIKPLLEQGEVVMRRRAMA